MKKKFSFLFLTGLLVAMQLVAQTPNAFQFQAVVRNSQGSILKSQSVNIRFTLHKSTADGVVAFQETHAATTTESGLVSLQIGTGTPATGSYGLAEIDWTIGNYFMQVEIDNGSGYYTLSTQQLLSIPFAKYAQAAGNLRIKSPDGSLWNVTIANDGSLTTTKVQ
ncbi:MAG: hypothetical protein QM800_02135 [Paludibacter sp.]